MSTEAQPRGTGRVIGRKRRSTVLPEDYSWLSVPVPTKALYNLRIQALRSAMPWPEYVAAWAMDAFPYNQGAGAAAAQEPVPVSGN